MPKTIYYQQTNSTRSINPFFFDWTISAFTVQLFPSPFTTIWFIEIQRVRWIYVWKIFVVQGLFIHICKYMYPSKLFVSQIIPIFCNKNLSPRYPRKRRTNKQFISEILKPSITFLSSITANYFFKNLFGIHRMPREGASYQAFSNSSQIAFNLCIISANLCL